MFKQFNRNMTNLKSEGIKTLYADNMPFNSDKCKVALTAPNKRIIKEDYILNNTKNRQFRNDISRFLLQSRIYALNNIFIR